MKKHRLCIRGAMAIVPSFVLGSALFAQPGDHGAPDWDGKRANPIAEAFETKGECERRLAELRSDMGYWNAVIRCERESSTGLWYTVMLLHPTQDNE